MKTNTGKTVYRIFAIVLNVLLILISIPNLVVYFQYSVGAAVIAQKIVGILLSIALIVLLCIGRMNIGFVVVAAAILAYGVSGMFDGASLWSILNLLRDVAVLVCAVFSCIPSLEKSHGIVKKIWFLPALLIFLAGLTNIPSLSQMMQYGAAYGIVMILPQVLASIISALPDLFLGLWFASKKPAASAPADAWYMTAAQREPAAEAVNDVTGNENINIGGYQMDQTRVDMYIMSNQKYFPAEKIPHLRDRLAAMDPQKFSLLAAVELKDPTTILIISIFLGSLGIDRFMLGDTGMGVLKLLTGGCCGILTIIDWFTVSDKAKEVNFNHVMAIL